MHSQQPVGRTDQSWKQTPAGIEVSSPSSRWSVGRCAARVRACMRVSHQIKCMVLCNSACSTRSARRVWSPAAAGRRTTGSLHRAVDRDRRGEHTHATGRRSNGYDLVSNSVVLCRGRVRAQGSRDSPDRSECGEKGGKRARERFPSHSPSRARASKQVSATKLFSPSRRAGGG